MARFRFTDKLNEEALMVASQALDAYRQTARQAAIHPVKLIHMMYERVLTHLEYAEAGIKGNDPKKRGENLSKAIAIITELHASVNAEDGSEAAGFLRGLYTAILTELPKVSVSGDVEIVQQAARYIKELKKIWEETAMREIVSGKGAPAKSEQTEQDENISSMKQKMDPSPEAPDHVQGVSVSI